MTGRAPAAIAATLLLLGLAQSTALLARDEPYPLAAALLASLLAAGGATLGAVDCARPSSSREAAMAAARTRPVDSALPAARSDPPRRRTRWPRYQRTTSAPPTSATKRGALPPRPPAWPRGSVLPGRWRQPVQGGVLENRPWRRRRRRRRARARAGRCSGSPRAPRRAAGINAGRPASALRAAACGGAPKSARSAAPDMAPAKAATRAPPRTPRRPSASGRRTAPRRAGQERERHQREHGGAESEGPPRGTDDRMRFGEGAADGRARRRPRSGRRAGRREHRELPASPPEAALAGDRRRPASRSETSRDRSASCAGRLQAGRSTPDAAKSVAASGEAAPGRGRAGRRDRNPGTRKPTVARRRARRLREREHDPESASSAGHGARRAQRSADAATREARAAAASALSPSGEATGRQRTWNPRRQPRCSGPTEHPSCSSRTERSTSTPGNVPTRRQSRARTRHGQSDGPRPTMPAPLVEPVEQRGVLSGFDAAALRGRGRRRGPSLRWRLRRRNGRGPLFAEKDGFLEGERAIEGAAPAPRRRTGTAPASARPAREAETTRRRGPLAICADGQEPPFAALLGADSPAGQPRSESPADQGSPRGRGAGPDALGSSPFRLCGARGQPGTAKAGANRSNSAAEGTWRCDRGQLHHPARSEQGLGMRRAIGIGLRARQAHASPGGNRRRLRRIFVEGRGSVASPRADLAEESSGSALAVRAAAQAQCRLLRVLIDAEPWRGSGEREEQEARRSWLAPRLEQAGEVPGLRARFASTRGW